MYKALWSPRVLNIKLSVEWSTTCRVVALGQTCLLGGILLTVIFMTSVRASADPITSAQAQRIVSQYSPSITTPGSCCSSEAPSGGALMGNGNLGVVVVNPINTKTFLLGKNEFWSLSGGQVEPMASMAFPYRA